MSGEDGQDERVGGSLFSHMICCCFFYLLFFFFACENILYNTKWGILILIFGMACHGHR